MSIQQLNNKGDTKKKDKNNFTFMLPCIVIDFFLNNQQDALIIQVYSVIKLHVSGIFSVHCQEFSTVRSALVSFMQVFDDRFQAESGWNCK
jgi:predicted permease